MKAKVIETGEIIEVKEWRGTSDVVYSTPDMNKFYQESDLEIISGAPQKVIEGYVARDEDGLLNLFDKEPERIAECAWAYYPGHTLGFSLPKELFPEVTWESEPMPVIITIKPKE